MNAHGAWQSDTQPCDSSAAKSDCQMCKEKPIIGFTKTPMLTPTSTPPMQRASVKVGGQDPLFPAQEKVLGIVIRLSRLSAAGHFTTRYFYASTAICRNMGKGTEGGLWLAYPHPLSRRAVARSRCERSQGTDQPSPSIATFPSLFLSPISTSLCPSTVVSARRCNRVAASHAVPIGGQRYVCQLICLAPRPDTLHSRITLYAWGGVRGAGGEPHKDHAITVSNLWLCRQTHLLLSPSLPKPHALPFLIPIPVI